MKKTFLLFDGRPDVTSSFIGTFRRPKVRRDRWGKLARGDVRMLRAYLGDPGGDPHIATLYVPRHWYGNRSTIKLKITAEIS